MDLATVAPRRTVPVVASRGRGGYVLSASAPMDVHRLARAIATAIPLAVELPRDREGCLNRGYCVTTARWKLVGSQWFWDGIDFDRLAGDDVLLLVAPAPGMEPLEFVQSLRAALRALLEHARCVRVHLEGVE